MSADKISRQILLSEPDFTEGPSVESLAISGQPSAEKTLTQQIFQGIVFHDSVTATALDRLNDLSPCQMGRHRWAYLSAGGQACGYCGTPRR